MIFLRIALLLTFCLHVFSEQIPNICRTISIKKRFDKVKLVIQEYHKCQSNKRYVSKISRYTSKDLCSLSRELQREFDKFYIESSAYTKKMEKHIMSCEQTESSILQKYKIVGHVNHQDFQPLDMNEIIKEARNSQDDKYPQKYLTFNPKTKNIIIKNFETKIVQEVSLQPFIIACEERCRQSNECDLCLDKVINDKFKVEIGINKFGEAFYDASLYLFDKADNSSLLQRIISKIVDRPVYPHYAAYFNILPEPQTISSQQKVKRCKKRKSVQNNGIQL